MVREPVEPRLRPEGPQLRIAEDQYENPREKKTYRPGIANIWPARTEPMLCKNKNSREHHKKASEVMIKFALAFVSRQFFRCAHGCHRVWRRRTHIHSGHAARHFPLARLAPLAIVPLVRRGILRADQRLVRAKYQGKQQACARKLKFPEQFLA